MVNENAETTEQGESPKHGFEKPLPDGIAPWDLRILRKIAVTFGICGIVENVDYVGSADRLGIVDAGILPPEIIAQLGGTLFGDELHVFLRTELEATGRTRFDARGLEAFAYSVGAERTFIDALSCGIEARDVEWAAGDAKLTADAVFLIEIYDAVGVFDDRAVGGAGMQATGVGAVHALVFAHQPLDGAIGILVLIELDEVPEIPARLGHRLVGVVEDGGAKGMSFHSTQATSQALQPMQVVVSTSLQTSRSRCMPWPGEGLVWPEIISACRVLRSAILLPRS